MVAGAAPGSLKSLAHWTLATGTADHMVSRGVGVGVSVSEVLPGPGSDHY